MRKSVLVRGLVLIIVVLLVLPGVLVGCADGTTEAEPIVIGVPVPLGDLTGSTAMEGIVLAVEEINAKGGVDVAGTKRPFKIEVVDTRDVEVGVPVSEVLLAVEKLILEKKADFLVGGPVRSEAALAVMDLLYKYKKVLINSTGSKSPALHGQVADNYDKYKYYFKTTSHAGLIAGRIFATIDEMELKEKYGFDKVYIMAQDVAHTRAGADYSAQVLAQKGWTVFGPKLYATGATDFSMGLLEIKEEGAQLLLLWMDMPELMILIQQWRDLEIPALIFGLISYVVGEDAWEGSQGAVNYVMADLVDPGTIYIDAPEEMPLFWDAHIEMWGESPEGEAGVSYDAIYILADAIERAGTLDSEAMVTALEQTDLMGAGGRYRFDPQSHLPTYSNDPNEGLVVCEFQWQDGDKVVLLPQALATGSLILPPWMIVEED